MRRWIALLSAVLLLVPVTAAHAEFDYNSIPTPHMIVVDGNDINTVFYERAADERAYPASTTKIMTCMLALESGDPDDTVTVGDEVLGTPELPFTSASSLMGLKPGDTVALRDLIYGLMIVSGNDAAAAIAVHVGGSVPGFVDKMNEKAAALGMSNTHFANPHGVQNDNHYTTARDMAKLMAYALQNPDFCEIDKTISYTVPSSGAVHMTTNRLLRNVEGDPVETYYEYAIGGKTGDTNAAGKCLVAVAERDGARVIVVLFGDKIEMYGNDAVYNNIARFINAKDIFVHVFDTEFSAASAQELNVPSDFFAEVSGGDPAALIDGTKLELTADLTDLFCRLRTSEMTNLKVNAAAITTELDLPETVAAPVSAGQAIGTVRYLYQGKTLFSAVLTAMHDVAADPNATQAPAVSDDGITPPDAAATPLLEKGHRNWTTGSVLLLVFVLLIVLLIALIVVFVITERKRRYERRRRNAAKRRKRRY